MTNKVPTNVITGFLGVGKTTAILNLLKNKPENESWAVLVNEFGEIGIDGAMMTEHGALIKEVPGGCMCCTAGVPMSVGINTLLRQGPDRLLIEPTGLGHPKQVVATLTSEQYSPYVDLKATIALLDPRNLSDVKYTSNSNFNDQLDSADIVIANKADLCDESHLDSFSRWLDKQTPKKIYAAETQCGQIEPDILDMVRSERNASPRAEHHHHHHSELAPDFELPAGEKFIRRENKGQGYYSCGWLFDSELIFSFDGLFGLFASVQAERLKAVVNTEKGCYAFNVSNGIVSVNEMSLEGYESRIEIINREELSWLEIEAQLRILYS
ncbi:GTP-binding protein [Vibrio sp. JC009]|uniref:CobW family GTP-binding protein n=1 Tax=Vibrio sp. JC009 TaxID=2912314 RepID=UPI0023B05289|nr:GTP-binding protein [Vibrio sp. JC009]WED24435.1 GTP-binding protein [Vibrio sp. JC009]